MRGQVSQALEFDKVACDILAIGCPG